MTEEKFKETFGRTASGVNMLIAQAVEPVRARYLDPKNASKGSHREIESIKMYRYIQQEALEAHQAYRNNEGIQREIEEISDIILFSLFRIDQLIKQKQKLKG